MATNQSPPLDPKVLAARITEYLSLGGLFNPEMANHDAVRDLLTDCRAALSSPEQGAEAVSVPPEAEWESLRAALVECAIPYNALLMDEGSRRWIAPKVWDAIVSAVKMANDALRSAASQGEAEQGREGVRAEYIAWLKDVIDVSRNLENVTVMRRILSALERAPRQEKGISAKASKAAMHVAAQRLLVHTDAISASDLDMVAEDVITAYQLALSGTHP